MLQHPDGGRQVPLGEVQVAEAVVDKDRSVPSAYQRDEAERLLSVAPALGESPELAQGPRQPPPGSDPKACPEPVRLPVRRLDVPPLQLGRPAKVAKDMACRPQVMGC